MNTHIYIDLHTHTYIDIHTHTYIDIQLGFYVQYINLIHILQTQYLTIVFFCLILVLPLFLMSIQFDFLFVTGLFINISEPVYFTELVCFTLVILLLVPPFSSIQHLPSLTQHHPFWISICHIFFNCAVMLHKSTEPFYSQSFYRF